MSAPLLQIEGLTLAIEGAPILRDVSLALESGEVLGLVGESGSGKSLTAMSVLGLLPPGGRAVGAVTLKGRELLSLSERKMDSVRGRDIGMVFQEPMTALDPLMRIGDQVAEVFRIHLGSSRGEARRAAGEALERAGLRPGAKWAARYPHELSGGQRQRAAIAMARKDHMDLSVGIAMGSCLQIALFVAPVLVLSSRLIAPEPLTFGFNRLEIGALFMAVLIGGTIAADGRSNWYKGVQLVAFYLILATMFYLIPAETAPTLARFP